MTAKEYLEQIKTIQTKIRILNDEVIAIKALLGVQAVSYDRVGSNPNINEGDKMLSLILRLIDKQNEMVEETFKLLDKRSEIIGKVYQLKDERHVRLLYMRYFQMKKWEDIAEEMSYSRQRVTDLHTDALNELEKIISQ